MNLLKIKIFNRYSNIRRWKEILDTGGGILNMINHSEDENF